MIGIFDSGVGGLAVWRELLKLLPESDITYLADTAAFPYGSKSPGFIIRRAKEITRTLCHMGARLIVVACNTATVVSIKELRHTFPVPFVGVVPPVKVAASTAGSRNETIFVLLTQNTAAGSKYTRLVTSWAGEKRVEAFTLPILARVVEDGSFRQAQVAESLVHTLRNKFNHQDPQKIRIVLGCTHYVFLRDLLAKALGPDIEIFDPCPAVAMQAVRILNGDPPQAGNRGKRVFLSTGDPEKFALQAGMLLGIDRPEVSLIEI